MSTYLSLCIGACLVVGTLISLSGEVATSRRKDLDADKEGGDSGRPSSRTRLITMYFKAGETALLFLISAITISPSHGCLQALPDWASFLDLHHLTVLLVSLLCLICWVVGLVWLMLVAAVAFLLHRYDRWVGIVVSIATRTLV